MASFNCDCTDTNSWPTLADYRTRMLIELGYAAVSSNPPPGMAIFCDTKMAAAQQHLYLEYPALRTRRFFRWSMIPNERFYGILDNDENWTTENVTLTIASPCVVTFSSWTPVNGRLVSLKLSAADEDAGTGALPTGITEYQRYYVINASGNTCQLSLTSGGTAIDTSGTQSGQIVGSYSPSTDCVFNLSTYHEIENVLIVLPNNVWLPMSAGIPPEWYTTVQNPGIPSRYEIRQCLEVFPAPNSDQMAVWVKGHFGLAAFTADTDQPTIDGELVYLWALANAKSHYGQPDAKTVGAQATARLNNLIAGTHLTKKYVPGTKVLPPAVMPVFLPLNGAPP